MAKKSNFFVDLALASALSAAAVYGIVQLKGCVDKEPVLEQRVVPEKQPEIVVEEPVIEAPWQKYILNDFPEYSALLPKMHEESERTGVPLEHLAIICLTESKGKGGTRYEPAFQKRYIDTKFDGEETNDNRRYRQFFRSVQKKNISLTEEQFREQLATSTGPFQIMYATAFDRGFRGSFEELSDPETNVVWAATHMQKGGIKSGTPLETTCRFYNTNSKKGAPHPGYLDRAKAYCAKLGIEYTK